MFSTPRSRRSGTFRQAGPISIWSGVRNRRAAGRGGRRTSRSRCSLTARCLWVCSGGLLPTPIQRIEDHREGGVGLAAVLRAKAEEDDAAFAVGHGDGGGFAGQLVLARDPAGEEDVAR